MWGRLGPRFALEAAFLILLAVGLGLADQDWVVIIAVMGGGWVLVSLIELFASRRSAWVVPPVERAPASAPPPPAPGPLLEPEPISAPAPPPPVAEDTEEVEAAPEPAATEREPPREVEPVAEGEPHDEVRREAELQEPLDAESEESSADAAPEPISPERRRWWWFGRRPKEEAQEELIEPEVEVPKHVRRLTPGEAAERAPAGAAEEEH
ncbi:MAG: hypothetical protein M3322_12120 [Actinomycetota bacterium]|nr:hypothetical protein [Actinomycetota bacterium]